MPSVEGASVVSGGRPSMMDELLTSRVRMSRRLLIALVASAASAGLAFVALVWITAWPLVDPQCEETAARDTSALRTAVIPYFSHG